MGNSICYVNQSGGYLDNDIIDHFIAQGISVTFYTGSTFKREGSNPETKIVELKAYNKRNTLTRFFSWFLFSFQVTIRLLFKRRYSIFLVSNPPLSVFIPFVLRLKNYALLIWDIYPDILVSYGYISDNSIINKIWKNINKKVFSKAKVVFTLGEKMREVLLTYCADANVIVNPLWTNIIEIPQVDRKNNFFAQKYGIEDNFVIMYSGNLGKTHDVEFIVDLAISMQDCDSIKFVIIGDGYKKDIISQRIKDSSLTNCLLLPFQNLSDLPYSLSCADIGIVTLSSDASKYSIPSKIFNMMAAGEAFLAIADKDSELASIVNEFDLGKSFSVNQLDLMKEFIFELIRKTDMLIKYKANSQDASLHFTKINARKYHEVWFN